MLPKGPRPGRPEKTFNLSYVIMAIAVDTSARLKIGVTAVGGAGTPAATFIVDGASNSVSSVTIDTKIDHPVHNQPSSAITRNTARNHVI